MTKRRMLTHKELGIPHWVHKQLKAVRAKLLADEFQHAPNIYSGVKGQQFNMDYVARSFSEDTVYYSIRQHEHPCGTVACIGGWAYALQNGTPDGKGFLRFDMSAAEEFVIETRYRWPRLGWLFYPNTEPGTEVNYGRITPQQAVVAIENYLYTGVPRWHEVVSGVEGE